MIRRHSKNPLPRIWSDHPAAKGIVGEAEIRVSGGSRLRAKLIVFESNKAMARFFKDALDKSGVVTPDTMGICCPLTAEVFKIEKDGTESGHFWEVDPRYFCLIGLLKDHLRMEIITHEAVHAGFAYAARQNCKQWVKGDVLDEEEVCYPAGRIASFINQFLSRRGFYDLKHDETSRP